MRHRLVSGRPVRVSSLPQGIYIVKIAADSQTFVQRIVKL
ncbi:MAG: T9SS type A sorting domain-containing protein [Bacteroidaceae bacterium]|nr:T9SS type A sorting domain-containing protein [Bacteroidaceae bacterium]